MVRKKIDNRIRVLIENGVATGHRTMFAVVGEKARDQVIFLHHLLSKTIYKGRPSVLWCYKKDLGFSSHRQKKSNKLRKKTKSGNIDVNEEDPFEIFVLSTKIRYCYYKETHTILGNTYGMCILQDFEALTPNILARTIETVEGGGIIVFLLQNINSLKQLYTMHMDAHNNFRTEAHQEVVSRFNERFILSLSSCERCLVIDDQLRVLPIFSTNLKIEPVNKGIISNNQEKLTAVIESLRGTKLIFELASICKTVDQAKSLLKMIEAISEKTLRSTISLTAARGRGKSATLGLAIAGAIAHGYSNIYVTSPSPDNLNTLFEFIFKGLEALEYQEHQDYSIVRSTNAEHNKAVIRINVFTQESDHRQTIQYIHPTDTAKLSLAELLVIDEAAAIPLPYVKAMLGPYLIFLSSTINGYEGTGRSLSLKLLQELRPRTKSSYKKKKNKSILGRHLEELTLEESIRYKPGDQIEKWLTELLFLDATAHTPVPSNSPEPNECELYYINRDTLFSYHKVSELFLKKLVALYMSSDYKSNPDDLQVMSDAPSHHLFCLLGPVNPEEKALPEILVIVQLCLEGEIKTDIINNEIGQESNCAGRKRRTAGDLIPWLMAHQYNDKNFPTLGGARIIRIVTHPDYQNMGYKYKIQALKLLKEYYKMELNFENKQLQNNEKGNKIIQNDINTSDGIIKPRSSLPPLLLKVNERFPEKLNYIGVKFELTEEDLEMWKQSGFVPTYISQKTNNITGERSCVMLCNLEENPSINWLKVYWTSFLRRFVSLLMFLKDYSPHLALKILKNNAVDLSAIVLNKTNLDDYFTSNDLVRFESYKNNDKNNYYLIKDLVPQLARLYFLKKMGNTQFSDNQEKILLGFGMQGKNIHKLVEELKLNLSDILDDLKSLVCVAVEHFRSIPEENSSYSDKKQGNNHINNLNDHMSCEDTPAIDKKSKAEDNAKAENLQQGNFEKCLEQYRINDNEQEWNKVISRKGVQNIVSIKRKKEVSVDELREERKNKKKKPEKKRKRFNK